jgi:FkbM family methyltransferase
MTVARGLLRPFFASSVAKALRALVRIGVLLIAARAFTLSEVGQFAFVMGAGTLVIGLLDLGVTSLLQREVAARGFEADALERGALLVRLVSLPIGVGLAWLLVIALTPDTHPSALGTLGFAAGLATAEFLAGVRRARGQFSLESLELAPSVIAGLGAGFAVALLDGGLPSFQWAIGVATVLGTLPRLTILSQELWSKHGSPGPSLRRLLWDAKWFWVITAGALILFEAPVILLQELATEEAVALYATAMRAVGLASQPFVVLAAVFLPSLSYEGSMNRAGYLQSVRAMNRLFLIAVPAAAVLAVGGGFVFLAGAGPEYTRALPILWLLVIGALVYLGAPNAGPLLVEGLERALAITVLVASSVTVGLCLVLIPGAGGRGAALAAAGGFLVGKMAHGGLYRRARLPLFGRAGWAIICTTAAWAWAAFLLPAPWNMLMLAAGGSASGIGTLRSAWQLQLFQREHTTDFAPPGRAKTRAKEWLLRRAPHAFWIWQRLRHGRHGFEAESPLLQYLCKIDRISLDIGANYGVCTHDMLPYSQGVHAFEPIPHLARLLKAAFRREGPRVVVHQTALSDTDGSAILRIPHGFPGRSTIDQNNPLSDKLPPATGVTTIAVPRRRLDSFNFPPVGFIKIDVKGDELEVLRGGAGMLERYTPALLVEVEERHRPNAVDLVTLFLSQFGYEPYFLLDGRLHHLTASNKADWVRNLVFLTSNEIESLSANILIEG